MMYKVVDQIYPALYSPKKTTANESTSAPSLGHTPSNWPMGPLDVAGLLDGFTGPLDDNTGPDRVMRLDTGLD